MNGKNKKAILFDKDGTLIRYNTIWPDATEAMMPIFRKKFPVKDNLTDKILLANLGLGPEKVEDSTAIASGTSWDIAQVLRKALKDEAEIDLNDVLQFVRDYFYQYTIDHQEEIQAIGNVKLLFTRLNDEGYTLGIVTADDYQSTKFTLEYLEIDHLVTFVATGDQYKAKPAAEAIETFSAATQIPAKQILFIGDSIVDMEFSKNCRKGIAVLSGVGEKATLAQYTDAIYPTIHDIPFERYF